MAFCKEWLRVEACFHYGIKNLNGNCDFLSDNSEFISCNCEKTKIRIVRYKFNCEYKKSLIALQCVRVSKLW